MKFFIAEAESAHDDTQGAKTGDVVCLLDSGDVGLYLVDIDDNDEIKLVFQAGCDIVGDLSDMEPDGL